MIWINDFFLFMSLSGSVALLLYYLAKVFLSRYMSVSCQYLLLKICMCFYLLPVPLLSEELRVQIRIFFPEFSYGVNPSEVWIVTDLEKLIFDTPDGYVLPRFSWLPALAMTVWLVIAAGILLVQYKNYQKIKQLAKHTTVPSVQLDKISGQIQKGMKIHRKITVYSLNEEFTPFCYGVFSPKIIFPSEYGMAETELILRHELQHIKSSDFLFRLMSLLIIALHFFNPFAYLLSYEIRKASELACDEKVMKGSSEEQQTIYMNLLLNIMADSPFRTYTHSFGGNSRKNMKERIYMMKHPRKTKLAVFICCIMFTAFFSVLPAAAYELPQIVETDSYNPDDLKYSYLFSTSETSPYEEETDFDERYFRTSDCFFMDEEGNLFPCLEDTLIAPQSTCSHSYVSGYLYEHKLNSSGGCTYSKYSAKRCSKCGAIKDRTFISSSTYAVCPHK